MDKKTLIEIIVMLLITFILIWIKPFSTRYTYDRSEGNAYTEYLEKIGIEH
ncbi:hypothetical protein SAMN02910298_02446 [Pseudobutyrivibrio sp. YE44]|uniref:hypothetical protein n=1 Tax=Pseudobutyrivibrio sp. YE44 TaxID=1520802 RepID=UPI00088443D0|nr:hypothetical protein [Pseudobutyrivibrio sp. YE44]SDB48543.1 hypothetical protein SAMN02910298_02446 [Pseudobutyrivibrio sp. YE44]